MEYDTLSPPYYTLTNLLAIGIITHIQHVVTCAKWDVYYCAGFRIAIRSTWCGHSHGSTIQMDVDGTYTVSAIRKKYHSLIDSRRSMTLPPAQVYHKQMLLQDASTLQQCGITSESILEVYGVLYCRTITGKIITVRAKCSDVIEEIKTRIQDQEGIPPFQMTFSYAGRYMEDRRTLSDYKVTDRSTILLTFRLRGKYYYSENYYF